MNLNIKKIDHVVITTECIERCVKFYQCLGFSIRDAGGRYELLAGDFKINVHLRYQELSPHAEHIQAGSADLCFEFAGNLDKWKEELIRQGITIELGVVERNGIRGHMRSLYLRDPDGNLIEFGSY